MGGINLEVGRGGGETKDRGEEGGETEAPSASIPPLALAATIFIWA